MSRLVPEPFAEPLDYLSEGVACKETSVKDEKLAGFRWVFPMRGSKVEPKV
jgi:hypothetical protein